MKFFYFQVFDKYSHKIESDRCLPSLRFLYRSCPICLLLPCWNFSLQCFLIRIHFLCGKFHFGSLSQTSGKTFIWKNIEELILISGFFSGQPTKQKPIWRNQPRASICRFHFCTHHFAFSCHEFYRLNINNPLKKYRTLSIVRPLLLFGIFRDNILNKKDHFLHF